MRDAGDGLPDGLPVETECGSADGDVAFEKSPVGSREIGGRAGKSVSSTSRELNQSGVNVITCRGEQRAW